MSWLDSLRFPLENDYQQMVFERQACWPLLTSLMSAFEQFHRFPGFNKICRLQEKIQQVERSFSKMLQHREACLNQHWWTDYCFGSRATRKQFMILRNRYAVSLQQVSKHFSQLRQLYFAYFLDRQKAGMDMAGFQQLLAIFPRGPLYDYYQAHYLTMNQDERSIKPLLKRALGGTYPHPYQLEQLYIRGLHFAAISDTKGRQKEHYLSAAKQCLWDAAVEGYAPAMWTCGHYFSAEQLIPTPKGQFNARILLWAQAVQENFIPAIADLSAQYISDMQQQILNPRLRTYQYLFSHLLSQDSFFQKISLAAYAHDSVIIRDLLSHLTIHLRDSDAVDAFPVLQLLKLQKEAEHWQLRLRDQNYLEAKVGYPLVSPRVVDETLYDEVLSLARQKTVLGSAADFATRGDHHSRILRRLLKSYSKIAHRSCFMERLIAVDFMQDLIKQFLLAEPGSIKQARRVFELKAALDQEAELLLRLPMSKKAQARREPARISSVEGALSFLTISDAPFA